MFCTYPESKRRVEKNKKIEKITVQTEMTSLTGRALQQ
jgi:hypothetical protein